MNNVTRNKNRNTKTRFLYSYLLYLIDFVGINNIKDRTYFTFTYTFSQFIKIPRTKLVHLTELFFHCHLTEQCFYSGFDGRIFIIKTYFIRA